MERHFDLRERKVDLEFLNAAREAAEMINSAILIKALYKELARVSLVDEGMIEKIDRELGRTVGVGVVAPAQVG